METMDSTTRQMVESRSALGTWEITSIDAGSMEVMVSVLNLGDFAWTTCTDPDCFKAKRRAKVDLLSPAGPDALRPPWSLPVCSIFPKNRAKWLFIIL